MQDALVLGGRLHQVCRLHHRQAERVFERMGLHRGQPPLLRLLWERDGRTPSELADGMQVSRATASRMIARMEQSGFIVREADPDDERATRVHLTSRGREVQEAVFDGLRSLDATTFAGLTAGDRATFLRMLDRIKANLDDQGKHGTHDR